MKIFRRVAVLGAGTMGSRIAAHFANAGIPALLLDITVPNQPLAAGQAADHFDQKLRPWPPRESASAEVSEKEKDAG